MSNSIKLSQQNYPKLFYTGIFICTFLASLILLLVLYQYSVLYTVTLKIENNSCKLLLDSKIHKQIDFSSINSVEIVFNNDAVKIKKKQLKINTKKHYIEFNTYLIPKLLRQNKKVKLKINYSLLKIFI